jgi:predicted P-loop ATPase
LQDETGSRRYICISIPSGEFIDNDGEIDYQQLYAQAVYELNEAKTPYWFNNDEVARIQALNHVFMAQRDMKEMVELTFRKPEKGEKAESMNSTMMLQLIQKKFTSLKIDHSAKIRLGLVMSDLHYDSKAHSNVSFYQVVPLKSA